MEIADGRLRGLSLVEALVALALLAGVILGAVWLVQGTRAHVERSRRQGVALRAASALLDRAAAGPRRSWWDIAGTGTCAPASVRCRVASSSADSASPIGVWHARLTSTLPGGRADVTFEAVGGSLEHAAIVRVVAEVHWRDGAREARVSLSEALR